LFENTAIIIKFKNSDIMFYQKKIIRLHAKGGFDSSKCTR